MHYKQLESSKYLIVASHSDEISGTVQLLSQFWHFPLKIFGKVLAAQSYPRTHTPV